MKSAQVTDENVDGVCGRKIQTLNRKMPSQYHFVEGDIESILNWKEKYFADGYDQLLSQDETWWDNLHDYEREVAEFLLDIAPDLSDQVYMGQNLEQCIEILDSGVNADDFFRGTIFEGLECEALGNSGY